VSDQVCNDKGMTTDIENLLADINLQELVYHDVSANQKLDKIMMRWPLVKELAGRGSSFDKKGNQS